MLPAESMQFGYVGKLAHGAVGLGNVKGQFTRKSHHLFDRKSQVLDGDLFSAADIDMGIADFFKIPG